MAMMPLPIEMFFESMTRHSSLVYSSQTTRSMLQVPLRPLEMQMASTCR